MLFSEPKIPQRALDYLEERDRWGFSALQRAENSSTDRLHRPPLRREGFSALQRAENSSTRSVACPPFDFDRFSALQRAENSSTQRRVGRAGAGAYVSVLFSEPKIPQPNRPVSAPAILRCVSVLFSEPKIPQPNARHDARPPHCVSVLFSEPKIPQRKDE